MLSFLNSLIKVHCFPFGQFKVFNRQDCDRLGFCCYFFTEFIVGFALRGDFSYNSDGKSGNIEFEFISHFGKDLDGASHYLLWFVDAVSSLKSGDDFVLVFEI